MPCPGLESAPAAWQTNSDLPASGGPHSVISRTRCSSCVARSTTSGTGRVSELQLRYLVAFRLTDRENREYLPASEVQLKRDLTYSDTDVLGKEQEEGLLYRDKRSEDLWPELYARQHTGIRASQATWH